jgi:alpha-D-xyloside xylohydrolase
MGVAGIPWLTTDIGGFYGGRNDDPDFKELLVRWFEYGTFCPVMRLHGQRLPRKIPIGTCGGGACASYSGNEVWTYGKEFEAIFTKYLFMREKLKPYISLLMKEAHEKGTPIMRMLSFEFPEDEKAWEDQFSYMFGSDLLVSPVVNLGDRKKLVYLPKGHSWINAWTEEIMDGGNEVSIDAPLDKIPLFYKDTNDLNIVV